MDQSESRRYDTVLISWHAMQNAQTAIVLSSPRHKNVPSPTFCFCLSLTFQSVVTSESRRKHGYTNQFYVLNNHKLKWFWYPHSQSAFHWFSFSIDNISVAAVLGLVWQFIIDILSEPAEHDRTEHGMTLSIKWHRPDITLQLSPHEGSVV